MEQKLSDNLKQFKKLRRLFKKTQPLSFSYFLANWLTQLALTHCFFFPFLPFWDTTLLWINSGRMEIVHMLCTSVSVSHCRRRNFFVVFSFSFYRKSYWFYTSLIFEVFDKVLNFQTCTFVFYFSEGFFDNFDYCIWSLIFISYYKLVLLYQPFSINDGFWYPKKCINIPSLKIVLFEFSGTERIKQIQKKKKIETIQNLLQSCNPFSSNSNKSRTSVRLKS